VAIIAGVIQGLFGKGTFQGNSGKLISQNSQGKGVSLYVGTDTFLGWPEVFPCRTYKAREVTKMLLHAVNSKVRGSCSNLIRSRPTVLPRCSNKEAHYWELIGNCTHRIDCSQVDRWKNDSPDQITDGKTWPRGLDSLATDTAFGTSDNSD